MSALVKISGACDRAMIEAIPEPLASRVLVACQIQTGPGMTWTDRTYEFVRALDGQWGVDFGEGVIEPRRDWAAVLGWFWRVRPRDVELLEVA